jgi:hypothetical protein
MLPNVLADRLVELPEVRRHESRFEGEISLVAETVGRDAVSAVVEAELGPPAKPADSAVSAELNHHALVEAIGGIRASQTLYWRDLGGGATLYVAYWPWADGGRFTIKIGVYRRTAPPDLEQ